MDFDTIKIQGDGDGNIATGKWDIFKKLKNTNKKYMSVLRVSP